uniref:Uncharacterized protein n=1 Tax=Rhizophagus irregularis (strain DAOM 181602 / DAOM 197198 / MUCL 43194) TaxID=747089 RepID=U9UCR1_RHIID
MCEVAVNQDLDDLEKIVNVRCYSNIKVLKHKPIFILKRSEIKWTILNDNKQDIRSQQELEDESKPRTCLKYDRNDALMDLGHSVNVSKRPLLLPTRLHTIDEISHSTMFKIWR